MVESGTSSSDCDYRSPGLLKHIAQAYWLYGSRYMLYSLTSDERRSIMVAVNDIAGENGNELTFSEEQIREADFE